MWFFFSFFTLVLPLIDACMLVCVWRLVLNLYVRLWACSVWVTRAGCWHCRRDRLVRAKTFPCGRSYRHSLVNKLFEELPDINAFRDVTCADFWSAVAIGFLFIILLFWYPVEWKALSNERQNNWCSSRNLHSYSERVAFTHFLGLLFIFCI